MLCEMTDIWQKKNVFIPLQNPSMTYTVGKLFCVNFATGFIWARLNWASPPK